MPRLVVVLLALVPLVVACGSSGGQSGSGGGPGTFKRQTAIAYANCMRSHGVPNFPDPVNHGGGGLEIQASARAGSGTSMRVNGVSVNAPAFAAAMQSCRHLLPNGGAPSPQDQARMKAQALAMSRCMRSHGVPNFPDPKFQTGPGGGAGVELGGAGIDPSSPAFQAAQTACGSIFGGPRVAPPPG